MNTEPKTPHPTGSRTSRAPALHSDRTVVVAGGTGNVGRTLVRSFLEAGGVVVVPSRSQDKLDRLRESLTDRGTERLHTVVGDVGEERSAAGLVRQIADEHGPFDAAVATLGHFVPAPPLLEASLHQLQQVLEGYLIGHFVAARALIPALRDGGSYTFINGPLAFQPSAPQAGLVSTVTAAQAMFARILMTQVSRVRVNEVVLHTPFGWGEEAERRAPVQQEQVATYVSHLASERGAGIQGRSIHLDSVEKVQALVQGESQ